MNANNESDLGKINLLEYIKTLKEHYLEMQSLLAVKDSIIKIQGEALAIINDWNNDNNQNNREAGFKMFPVLQHDIEVALSETIKKVDEILGAKE